MIDRLPERPCLVHPRNATQRRCRRIPIDECLLVLCLTAAGRWHASRWWSLFALTEPTGDDVCGIVCSQTDMQSCIMPIFYALLPVAPGAKAFNHRKVAACIRIGRCRLAVW